MPRAAQYSAVCRYEAEEVAACLGVDLVTTSAKEDVNIEHVFRTIANTHLRPGPALPARTSEQAVSWRHARKQHGKQRQRRLQLQLRRQQLQLEERRYLPAPAGPHQPRSVQRRESRLVRGRGSVGSLGAEPGLQLEEMWEDPLLVSEVPLMLAPAPASRGHYSLVLRPQLGRETSVDSPGLIRLHPVFCPEDQDQWHSNLFSSLAASASSPSLVQSPAPSSGSRTRDSGSRASEVTAEAAAPDSAAQFLASPMFDSLKSRRWGQLGGLGGLGRCGVRGRSAKYSLAPGRGGEGLLANKCSIM